MQFRADGLPVHLPEGLRLVELELTDAGCVGHGLIRFRDLLSEFDIDSGEWLYGPVTCLYGENATGKSTVIHAIGVLRTLISGGRLDGKDTRLIRRARTSCGIRAVFRDGDRIWLEYEVHLTGTDSYVHVAYESAKVGLREGRLLPPKITVANGMPKSPAWFWNAMPARGKTADGQGSLLFSPTDGSCRLSWMIRHMTADASNHMMRIMPRLDRLADMADRLTHWMRNGVIIVTEDDTRPITVTVDGRYPIDLDHWDYCPNDRLPMMRHTIRMLDDMMSVTFPGLRVGLEEHPGSDGWTDIRMKAIRDGFEYPFAEESIGVKWMMRLLPLLLRLQYDRNVFLIVDGLDRHMGVVLHDRIIGLLQLWLAGQMLFVTRQIRVFNVTDSPYTGIILSTVDPGDRFVPFRGLCSYDVSPDRSYRSLAGAGWPVELSNVPSRFRINLGLHEARGHIPPIASVSFD
ncbi:ATP-binding protein [Bifidobacterium sp. SO1]|uniref:ATP-binding protein n=1 Tax=Bifidobacterium sp. SO1 TaxID=2809029 RepID=UPI001BDCD46C|nr:ATP-binding protein [Bifidobacterium sp. SO1]MBT1162967.1 hypothetical protein [Bifidobacterium sp. SO1]